MYKILRIKRQTNFKIWDRERFFNTNIRGGTLTVVSETLYFTQEPVKENFYMYRSGQCMSMYINTHKLFSIRHVSYIKYLSKLFNCINLIFVFVQSSCME